MRVRKENQARSVSFASVPPIAYRHLIFFPHLDCGR